MNSYDTDTLSGSIREHILVREALDTLRLKGEYQNLMASVLRNDGKADAFSVSLSVGPAGVRLQHEPFQYFDDIHGITLYYEAVSGSMSEIKVPLGYVSFRFRGKRPRMTYPPYRLFVTQIQGIQIERMAQKQSAIWAEYMREGLAQIRWERFLVQLVVVLGTYMEDVEQIWIQRAEENEYYRAKWLFAPNPIPTYQANLNQQLYLRYNVTARRLGFVEERDMYVLKLSKPPAS